MIRRTLTSFISIAGVGATILTIMVLTAPPHAGNVARGDHCRDECRKELKMPSCGDAYRKECKAYYHMDRWHHDTVRYGSTTINIWHRVSYDRGRQQYRYEYKIDYNGSKNVLMRWDVLDRMRSESPDSSCILDLRQCHPHKFTMWCNETPAMRKGTVQFYNNGHNTDDWNYWQCNQTSQCSGPVPASYPEQ